MSQTPPPTEADRIALTNMFKAIAEYGRKVRQRRQAECEKAGQVKPVRPKRDSENKLPAQQTKVRLIRKKKLP
jgi:hypothetical protein